MQPYSTRRQTLLQKIGQGVVIVPTNLEALRNADAHYPYRFDSSFYYLTGFKEPEAVLILIGGEQSKSILFCRDKDSEREVWDGFRYGPAAARGLFGFDETYSITQLNEMMPTLLANQPVLSYPIGLDTNWDKKIVGWLQNVRAQARSGISAPAILRDCRDIISEMRLYKDAAEITTMRCAATISASAHQRAMSFTQPGKMEYEIEAEILHEFRRKGSQYPAYPSIVAGGANACVLHYVDNASVLKDGDLLLIDAGCEVDGYASDITRTFPVNGKFSAEQRVVYEIVLHAQLAAIEAAQPGNLWDAPHQAALKILAQGLIDLELCQGSIDSVIESGSYKQFYMHRTGHWLGMDVHDVGDYKQAGAWRKLEPGMVFTVEPGLYIRPADTVPERFWNIGIRIEDDVLITPQGHEILSIAAPKTIVDIESLMS